MREAILDFNAEDPSNIFIVIKLLVIKKHYTRADLASSSSLVWL